MRPRNNERTTSEPRTAAAIVPAETDEDEPSDELDPDRTLLLVGGFVGEVAKRLVGAETARSLLLKIVSSSVCGQPPRGLLRVPPPKALQFEGNQHTKICVSGMDCRLTLRQ